MRVRRNNQIASVESLPPAPFSSIPGSIDEIGGQGEDGKKCCENVHDMFPVSRHLSAEPPPPSPYQKWGLFRAAPGTVMSAFQLSFTTPLAARMMTMVMWCDGDIGWEDDGDTGTRSRWWFAGKNIQTGDVHKGDCVEGNRIMVGTVEKEED